MAKEGTEKKNIVILALIVIIIIIMVITLIFAWTNTNNKKNSNNDNILDFIKEKEYMTREELTTIVEQSIIENQNEINELGDDDKKISKILYSKVIKKSKGQARAGDVKAAIELVLSQNNKE
ncbi:MAG: hypothetical protein PHT75_00650 [Bacilli bacterium]|nr:hypothetical protein [Bacilli bacterium]MDD3304625.1 hypothetical protein [Bacilli bacterium]MDD4053538.1 hypothetical protein [Bacilli bacterium]MDD4411495.1 hypothetical protein [Bacilli bacterium]